MKLFLYSPNLVCVSYDQGKPQVRPLLDNGFTYHIDGKVCYYWDVKRIADEYFKDEI